MLNKAFIIIIAVTNFSYAQLSVRNNAFVFVKDEVVFVEDDINLNEVASTIYLRDEAQIIQGAGTTGNSGIGELSVFQNGNVGAHEYNYWCSPIGSKVASNINNPFGITLLNDVVDLTNSNPAGASVGLAGFNGTSNPLNIEPYWIWTFIAADEYADWIHIRSNTAINPGEGFTMKGTNGSGDNQLYDFRGKPNNGTMAVNVLPNQITLVGNPYPSALDALAYIHDPENAAVIDGTLYYWEQDLTVNSHLIREYDGGYATYTITDTGMETYTPATFSTYDDMGIIKGAGNGGPSGKEPRRYIPIGQGFMVEGKATGTVKAKNSHRAYIKETNPDSEFFKTSNKKKKNTEEPRGFSLVPSDTKRFRLNIDFNNTYTRQLLENFHASATLGFDYGMESPVNVDDVLSSDAYFSNEQMGYRAQALVFNENIKIPLVIKVDKNMPVRIRVADIQNIDASLPIYVHDKETNTYTNLVAKDFDIRLESGNYDDRFEITFAKNNTLDIEDIVTANDFKILQNNQIEQLKILNPKNLDIKSFTLIDISGKQVMNILVDSNKEKHQYSTKSFSDGIYVVKIDLMDNQAINKKIIIGNIN